MKHASSLAIWLALGATFLGLFSTFIALLASQRKKAAAAPSTASPPEQAPPLRDGPTRPS